MSVQVNREFAIELCRKVEEIVPEFGAHVALTGGCLYKDGMRKDVDLVLYRIRQVQSINTLGMWPALAKIGLTLTQDHGWCAKCMYEGAVVDIFFPEVFRKTKVDHVGEEYPE